MTRGGVKEHPRRELRRPEAPHGSRGGSGSADADGDDGFAGGGSTHADAG
jgi:hypothetical protein